MAFQNSILASTVLMRSAIRSPNYSPGVSGWTINQDGTVEFSSGTFRGNVDVVSGNTYVKINASSATPVGTASISLHGPDAFGPATQAQINITDSGPVQTLVLNGPANGGSSIGLSSDGNAAIVAGGAAGKLSIFGGITGDGFAGTAFQFASIAALTVTQGGGAIAIGANYTRRLYLGNVAFIVIDYTMNGAGVAGNALRFTLPFTMDGATLATRGFGMIYDASANIRYNGTFESANGTQLQLVGDWSANGVWGTAPAIAIAAGDVIRACFVVEID